MMVERTRVRGVVGAGLALAVIAAVGVGVAQSSTAASARYVTAAAGTGDVTQTYTATGTISRKNTTVESFGVSGIVKTVSVSVGDVVEAGDPLAVLSKGELQLAVLNATTGVAQAEASLYSAQNPPSTSGGTSANAGNRNTVKIPTGGGSAGVTIDPKALMSATSRVNLAILNEADKCQAIFDSVLPEADDSGDGDDQKNPGTTSKPSASPKSSTSASQSADPSTSPSPSATATPSTEESDSSEAGTATKAAAKAATPTASASQLARVLEAANFTDKQLQHCANARAEVIRANTGLQQFVAKLSSPKRSGSAAKSSGSSAQAKASSAASGTGSTSSVSKSGVARAKASLLEAKQNLSLAKENLAKATLTSSISGTVGVVSLTAGSSSSGGSVTVVGEGSAVITFELPLTTRAKVSVNQAVEVTPAGSSETLSGKVTAISALETSGTSGDNPTYTTTVSASDPSGLLASGAKASVSIPVASATNVVRVPASAVTPTGSGTGTVSVVENPSASTASTVEVQTGAVGGGWVQITSGVTAGTLVVLADSTAAIPSNMSNSRRTTTSGSSSRPSSSAAPTAATNGGSSAAPSGSSSPR